MEGADVDVDVDVELGNKKQEAGSRNRKYEGDQRWMDRN